MNVEEIAEAVARRINSTASAAGSPHSRQAAPMTPKNSTPLRLDSAGSLAARLLN
jgi:hypothetical protein